MSNDLSADLASLKIDRDLDPDRRGPMRYVVGGGVIVGAAALVYFVLVPYLEHKVFKTSVDVTEISLVSPAQAKIVLTSTGYVKPQRVSNVSAKVPGKVSKIDVRQGAVVTAGDVLFELEIADQNAAIASANSTVAAARARAQTTRASLAEIKLQADRAKTLSESGVRPKSIADDLAARVRSLQQSVRAADAEVRAAIAQVRALKVNLDSFTIRAPISGTIINKPPELGEFVSPNAIGVAGASGSIEIADFDTLAIETDVPEQRLGKIQIDGSTEIVLEAFPDKRFRGKTTEIVPRVNRAKATVTVKVSFTDPATGVLPDMAARVSFLSEAISDSAIAEKPKLIVPGSAVTERGGAKMVFVLEDGRARMVPVTLGAPHADGFELVKGPRAGTKVVANPPGDLSDGQKVKERTD